MHYAEKRWGSRLFAAALGLKLVAGGAAQAGSPDDSAITQVLQKSAADWSRGDLAAFMQSYEDAAGTSFVTKTGLIAGYAALKSYYAAHYASGGKKMGRLALAILENRPLSPEFALVTGRFNLTRNAADGSDASGIFTLLMHRTPSGWRIAYDHTS